MKVHLGDIIEHERYMCPICRVPNDPKVFAMEKIGRKWYHTICIRKALSYLIENYNYRLDEHLRFLYCKKRRKKNGKK